MNIITIYNNFGKYRRKSVELFKTYLSKPFKKRTNDIIHNSPTTNLTKDLEYDNEILVFLYYLSPNIKRDNFRFFLEKIDKYLLYLDELYDYKITYDKMEYMIELIDVLFFTYYDRIYNRYISPKPVNYILENMLIRLNLFMILIHTDVFIFMSQSYYICSQFDMIIRCLMKEIKVKLRTGKYSENRKYYISYINELDDYIENFIIGKAEYITYNTYDFFLKLRRILAVFYGILDIDI